jgi:hypothetical protein
VCDACAAPRYLELADAGFWALWPTRALGPSEAYARLQQGLPAAAHAPAAWALWPDGGAPVRHPARSRASAIRAAARLPGGVAVLEQVAPDLWQHQGTVTSTPRDRARATLLVDDLVCKAARGPDLRRAAALLATALREHDRTLSAPALARYLERLNVNWSTLSAAGADALLTEARAFLTQATVAALLPAWQRTLEVNVTDLATRTKLNLKEQVAPSVQTSLSLPNRAAVQQIGTQSGFFLRDALGRRSAALTEQGRRIVAAGLEQGLGRVDIAGQLRAQLPGLWAAKGDSYSIAVASVATQRARVTTEIHSYQEAGIEQLVIVSVLDERTTIQCRLLDGQVLSVSGCMAHLNQVAAIENPEDIYTANPFLEIKRDADTGARYMQTRTGTQFAEVLRSGFGVADDRGLGRYLKAGNGMLAANVGPPPYHFRCRTTTEPMLTTVQIPRGYVARTVPEPTRFGLGEPRTELYRAPLAGRSTVMGELAPIDVVALPNPAVQARAGFDAARRSGSPAAVEIHAGRTRARTLPVRTPWRGVDPLALATTFLWAGANALATVAAPIGDADVLLAAVLANESASAREGLARAVLRDGERWARFTGHDCPGWLAAAARYRAALADPAADHAAAARAFLDAGTAGRWLRLGPTAAAVRFHAPP